MSSGIVGRSLPRKEGREKVEGAARYIDDMRLPGMIYGTTVRSHVPRGRIDAITFGEGVPWDEITVVTAADIPGSNVVKLLTDDQPFLADGVVNHINEPVVLLAHSNRSVLEAARGLVTLEITPLEPLCDMVSAFNGPSITRGADNIQKKITIHKGDVDAVFEAAQAEGLIIVEGAYETGAQEQLYIEPQGMLATADRNSVTVRGSLQCPYYVHKALTPLFGLPADRVRVIQAATGGGFGGKEEYPSIIAGHAALLAYHSGRPVKLIYDRAEDMGATTKRHPSITTHRTAVTPEGRIVAMSIDFMIDGGAYVTLSPVVLSRGVIHASGPYVCDHVRVMGHSVATNSVPYGAFRGFGAPQSCFAVERHMDRLHGGRGSRR